MPTIFNSDKDEEKNASEKAGKKTSGKTKKHSKGGERGKLKTPKDMDRHKLPGHTHNPFAAYCYYPDKADFVNRDPQEEVILLVRKHPITNIGWVSIAFLMLVSPAFLSVFTFFELLPSGYQIVFVLIWYLITIAFIFEEFLSWFFHVNIVTDERIIEVDFVGLFYREITDANIDQIQDVTVEIGGGIRTLVGYGNVVIQTAAQIPRIEFEAVPNPDEVSRILRELRIEEEVEKLEGRVR